MQCSGRLKRDPVRALEASTSQVALANMQLLDLDPSKLGTGVAPLVIYHRVMTDLAMENHGKSTFLIGKPSINGPFPMAMLNNQRVGRFDEITYIDVGLVIASGESAI